MDFSGITPIFSHRRLRKGGLEENHGGTAFPAIVTLRMDLNVGSYDCWESREVCSILQQFLLIQEGGVQRSKIRFETLEIGC